MNTGVQGMEDWAERRFQTRSARYLFGFTAVVFALLLRMLLTPLTGTGAPFVLFFGAALVTSLVAGVGPGIGVLAVSLPLATYMFAMRAGYSLSQAGFQALLYAIDGVLILVSTHRMNNARQQNRAAEALKLSEARFSGIVSISADAIISIDDQQRIVIFNDGAERIFGYKKAEVIGAPIEILIPERFREVHRRHVAAFATGSVTARRMGERVTTIAGLRKNGEEFPADAAISKLEVGDTRLLTVALRDVSELRRVEREQRFLAEASAALSTSLDYERTLVSVAELAVRDFADWCIVDTLEDQEHFLRLKVVSRAKSMQPVCEQLEAVQIDRGRSHLLRTTIETRSPVLIERMSPEYVDSLAQGPEHLQALRAIGAVSMVTVPLILHERLLGAFAFISSTPSRIYGQDDLRMAELLADRAAVAIENARLYRASVQAAQLRDRLLGVVAHDLRNPLSTVLMQASALQGPGADSEGRAQKASQVIHRAATRMSRLIEDLLDVARMEAGELSLVRARLAPRALVAEAIELEGPLARASSLELHEELTRDLPEISGDHDRLLQVFENLIGNAAKFTKPGGRITIGAVPRREDVLFWVADTGCGIPRENLDHIFDRFWQATRADRQGVGLGLTITKTIVEAHGGRIWVESAPEKGTTFLFTVPAASGREDWRAEEISSGL